MFDFHPSKHIVPTEAVFYESHRSKFESSSYNCENGFNPVSHCTFRGESVENQIGI